MQKKLTSLALVSTLVLCPAGKLSHADVNEETVRKIAAILEENENKLEMSKSQKLENENKALLEALQKLKAENENKELKNENNKRKPNSPSFWSKTVALFKDVSSVFLAMAAICGVSLVGCVGLAGAWTFGSAVYDCHFDEKCTSFKDKLTAERFDSVAERLMDFSLKIIENIHFVHVKSEN